MTQGFSGILFLLSGGVGYSECTVFMTCAGPGFK